jgi:hypothetical protein
MKLWYLKKLLKFLNTHFEYSEVNGNVIWIAKDKVIALLDKDGLEIVWDIFKEGVLRP